MRLAAIFALPLVLSLCGCQACVDESSSGGENQQPPSGSSVARGPSMHPRPRVFAPHMRIFGDAGAGAPAAPPPQ